MAYAAPAAAFDLDKCLARVKELESQKQPWLPLLESLAKIFLTRKKDFTSPLTPGEFLQDDIYSNDGQFGAFLLASVLLSMMWPDAERTFVIEPVRRLKGVAGVEEYFRFVTEEVQSAMSQPRAGLPSVLMEYFLEKVVFGTAGMGAFEGPKNDPSLPVVFESWDLKGMLISENAQGFVDTIYWKRTRTVRQIVEEYGRNKIDKVHPQVLELFKQQKLEDKIEVLYILEPKEAVEGAAPESLAAMSCRSVHVDLKHNFVMRESGYHELPVFVSRFFKTTGEVWGRSPAMTAEPAAANLNALSEGVIVATEKQLDPPLGLLDDGRLGGGVVDTSAGAFNVFNASGRITGEKPIFPLFTVGEMQSAKDLKEQLKEEVTQAFFLDRLLDLNNSQQMTAYETSVRNRLRGEALGSIFSRDEGETFTPLIGRVFNILYRSGRLGVVTTGIGAKIRKLWAKITGAKEVIVPQAVIDAIAAGLDVYEIHYISPAKRFMQSEKLQGIFTAADALAALEAVMPGICDNINPDRTAANIFKYAGAPTDCLNTEDERTAKRQATAQRQNTQDIVETARGTSEAARNMAQARTMLGTMRQPTGGPSE
jgi:hypothetical protein